jgi:hypothetical protein
MLGRAAQIELMDSTGDRSSRDVQQTLDYEMQLLCEAIAIPLWRSDHAAPDLAVEPLSA